MITKAKIAPKFNCTLCLDRFVSYKDLRVHHRAHRENFHTKPVGLYKNRSVTYHHREQKRRLERKLAVHYMIKRLCDDRC